MSQLEEFKSKLEIFHTLNPDILYAQHQTLFELATELQYPEFNKFLENILEEYLNSTFKKNERETIATYLELINQATTQLIESGEIRNQVTTHKTSQLSLQNQYNSKEWHQVIIKSDIPSGLEKAIQAIERRKNQDHTILYYLFEIHHRLNQEDAFQWQQNYLSHTTYIDPDFVRDLLQSWLNINQELPKELLNWVFKWCENELYKRTWKSIIKLADHLLQQQALLRIKKEKTTSIALNQLYNALSLKNDKIFIRWELKNLEKMTEQIHFFTELERKNRTLHRETYQRAAFKTLENLQNLFTPLLILSHLILEGPNGAEKLAYAMIGLPENEQKNWDQNLYTLAQTTVKRFFLNDLKRGQKPLKTIEKLCFGNETLYRRLIGELDFKSNQFESISQQQKVVDALAYNYASLRRGKLFKDELSRRFRRFMRMVHEDSLRHFLKPEHLQQVLESPLITEYSVAATEARKFITTYENTHIPAEEAFTIKEEFIANFHHRRRLLIKGIINNA
jgi:hypothetical protein